MISPPASATPTRRFPRPKCFSATSRERTEHEHTDAVKPKAMIQDNTRCIGCRACMVACKSWNDRPAGPDRFLRRRRLSEPARSRRQQLHAHYLQRDRNRRHSPIGCSGASSACTANNPPAPRRARPRRCSKRISAPWCSTSRAASAAGRACRHARSSFRNTITRASRRRSTNARSAPTAWKSGWNRRARPYARPARSASATATIWLPKRSGGSPRRRARTSRRSTASKRSAAPACCTFRRCRSSRSATLPACRRRRCPTSRISWLRVTAPVFAVLYAVFGALNWIVRRRMRRQEHDGEHT